MIVIISILIILLLAYLFTSAGKKLKLPIVVSLLICGLILDIPFIKAYLIEPNTNLIFTLGDIALVILMFIAGLESSWRIMYKEKKDATLIAIFSAGFSFALGTIIFRFLGFSWFIALIVGVCISITAEATKARVLFELKKLKTKVGSAMMGAGIIDDIIGLSLFVLITYLMKQAFLKEDFLIAAAIIAFFIGVFVQNNIGRARINTIERVFQILIVPFFFVAVALPISSFPFSSFAAKTGKFKFFQSLPFPLPFVGFWGWFKNWWGFVQKKSLRIRF